MSTHAIPAAQKARILAEALPFIRGYHAKTLIVRFGGGAMADPVLKDNFARDVALLRLVGMNPIVVHGGGWRIDRLLEQMGIPIHKHRGMRVTDEATLNVVEMVLGEINQELVGLINRHGSKAVGIDGQDGRFIHGRRMMLAPDLAESEAPDLGLVGDVERIDPDIVNLLLSRGFVPVIMPIGVDTDGTAYHINSDIVAGQLARTLRATWLKGFDDNGRPVTTENWRANPEGTTVYPSLGGGSNFQAPSYSPLTGWMYFMYYDGPGRYAIGPAPFEPGKQYQGRGTGDPFSTTAPGGQAPSSQGVMAFDPETGKATWKFELTERGLSPGVLATAGGLVFAASSEGAFMALDAKTGKLLWKFGAGANIPSSPISYAIDGKQYVAISSANVLYSFALGE